jgi:hypothetical protein
MRRAFTTLALLVAGCKSGPAADSTITPTESRSQLAAASAPAAEPAAAPAPAAAPYFSVEELAALGFSATATGDGETLLCSTADGGKCICLAPLDCGGQPCITYDQNVAAFRAALDKPEPGVTLTCERGQVGRCGSFRYFDFEGDLYRKELRWFDETGVVVGQRNVTDYQAYCNKQTRVRYQGRLPRCEKTSDIEGICGENTRPGMTPLEDLHRFTAPLPR